MSEEKIESVLKGNTLRVNWFLLRPPNDMVDARETARARRLIRYFRGCRDSA
jgi:hypothetical protein